MNKIILALACFLFLIIPCMKQSQADVRQQPPEAPQDIEVVYSPAPAGVPQDVWDILTEEDARNEATKQRKLITPRLESYQKSVDGLLN